MNKHIKTIVLVFLISLYLDLHPHSLKAQEPVENIFTRGLSYYIQREFKRAALEWKKLLDINPTHTRAKIYMEKSFSKYNEMEINFYKGLKEFNLEKYEEAIPFFQQTLMINPRHKKALYYLELCYKLLKKHLNKAAVAQEAVTEADKFMEEEEFTKAIALYKISLLLNPNDEQVKVKLIEAQKKEVESNQDLELMLHLQAAREYHEKKQYLYAVQEWSKALLLDPENMEAKEGLRTDKDLLEKQQNEEKLNRMISQGIDSFLNQDYNKSKEIFQDVIKIDRNNQVAAEYLKKIDEKLTELNKQKSLENEAEKHFTLGVDHFNKEKYENALEEFDLTLEIIPDHARALEYRQNTLAMLQKARAREMEEKNELIQKLLTDGIQYYQLGSFEEAIINFKKVLEMDPENNYAKEYLKLSEEALLMQKQSVIDENSPYYPIIKNLEYKGTEYLRNNDYDLALKHFQEIKDLFPLNRDANKNILKILYKTQPDNVKKVIDSHFDNGLKNYNNRNYNLAVYEFELVNEIDPDYPELKKYLALAKKPPSLYDKEIEKHFNLGVVYFSQKKYTEAINEWKRSIDLDRSPLSNKYLAKSLANISKAQYRIKAEKGIALTSISQQSKEKLKLINKHYYMGVAYYTGNDYEKALAEWQKVLEIDPNNALALKNIAKVRQRMKLSSQ